MSGCIIQCQQRLGQQEDGHRITGQASLKKNNPSACPSKMQRAEVHRQKQQLLSVIPHYATDWNLESIRRVEPWLQAKTAVQKKKNHIWCLTRAGSRWSSAQQILLQLTNKVSTFYFYCCHVHGAPLRIGSPPSFLFSSCLSVSIATSILHCEPSSLSSTQRGLPWDINHAVN